MKEIDQKGILLDQFFHSYKKTDVLEKLTEKVLKLHQGEFIF